jgi:hypothetical protein
VLWASRDQGLTWEAPVIMAAGDPAARGYTEPAIVETEPGRLLAMYRIEETIVGQHRQLYWNESLDGGKSWSVPAPAPFLAGACPRLHNLSDGRYVTTMTLPHQNLTSSYVLLLPCVSEASTHCLDLVAYTYNNELYENACYNRVLTLTSLVMYTRGSVITLLQGADDVRKASATDWTLCCAEQRRQDMVGAAAADPRDAG